MSCGHVADGGFRVEHTASPGAAATINDRTSTWTQYFPCARLLRIQHAVLTAFPPTTTHIVSYACCGHSFNIDGERLSIFSFMNLPGPRTHLTHPKRGASYSADSPTGIATAWEGGGTHLPQAVHAACECELWQAAGSGQQIIWHCVRTPPRN